MPCPQPNSHYASTWYPPSLSTELSTVIALSFGEIFIQFSNEIEPIYIPTNSKIFSYSCQPSALVGFFLFYIYIIYTGGRWHFIVDLIFISWMVGAAEHVSYVTNGHQLFSFSNEMVCFYCWILGLLYISSILAICQQCSLKITSPIQQVVFFICDHCFLSTKAVYVDAITVIYNAFVFQ